MSSFSLAIRHDAANFVFSDTFFFSHTDDLPKNVVDIMPQDCKKIFFRLTCVAQKCRCLNLLITNFWPKKKRESCTFFLPYLTLVFPIFLFSDAHDNIFMKVTSSKCTTANGCDSNAFCACGTVSGIYQCVCKQGYYGAGTPGHCYRKLSHSSPEKLRIYGQNLVWGVGGRRFA